MYKMISRRHFATLLSALWAAPAGLAAESGVLPAKVYPFSKLPVRSGAHSQFRPVFQGKTHTGFPIELHETLLEPGASPHPPHHHAHEEIFLVREGSVEVTINGESTTIGPGSVAYMASNVQHGVRNTGSAPAQYFVMALGNQHA
jgi:mannose-6-phosphate isomerase-like protein (cupin superfamily)